MLKKEVKVEVWTVTKEELNMTKIDGFLDLVFLHTVSQLSESILRHHPPYLPTTLCDPQSGDIISLFVLIEAP